MDIKLLANLSLRAFPIIKKLTQIFSINTLLKDPERRFEWDFL